MFSCILDFFCLRSNTHANHVLATAHTIPSVSFFGNWVENLKVTIHQLHRIIIVFFVSPIISKNNNNKKIVTVVNKLFFVSLKDVLTLIFDKVC